MWRKKNEVVRRTSFTGVISENKLKWGWEGGWIHIVDNFDIISPPYFNLLYYLTAQTG